MLRRFTLLLLAMSVMIASVAEAEARRRGRLPIFLGGGSGEDIVKVLDLPDIPALRRNDGRYIDLGYLHQSRGRGKWIGYIGSSSRYMPLNDQALRYVMRVSGLKKLPPVPERASSPYAWLLVSVVVIAVLFKYRSMLAGFLPKGGASSRRRDDGEAGNEAPSAEWARANAALAEATAGNAGPVSRAKGPAKQVRTRPRQSSDPVGGFGRRGLAPVARSSKGFGVRGA